MDPWTVESLRVWRTPNDTAPRTFSGPGAPCHYPGRQLCSARPRRNAEAIKRFYINGWFASRDWLAKNRETARNIVAVIYVGAKWADTHRNETAQILAKYGKVDVARIQRMIRAVFDSELDPKKLQPPFDIAWKYHGLERPLTAAQLIVND